MKIAFDVDVLAKQMSINDYVHKVADWGYKYIEQSPHPRINPFYKHPLFSKECQQEYKQAPVLRSPLSSLFTVGPARPRNSASTQLQTGSA